MSMMVVNPYWFSTASANLYDEIVADSPWVYYQLGETAGATSYTDSSSNARHLTDITATVTAGTTGLVVPGTCVDFDGTAGKIRSTSNEFGAAAATAFDGDLPFSMVAVINLDSIAGSPVLFHLGTASVAGAQGFFIQILSTGALRMQRANAAGSFGNVTTAGSLITTGVTYIVAATRAAGGTCELYIDGVDVGGGTLSGDNGMNATASGGGSRIALGCLQLTTPGSHTNGRLQHMAIFDSALSAGRCLAYAQAAGLA